MPAAAGPQAVHSLVLWFDTLFSERFCAKHPVELSTSPAGPQTHWYQTVLLLREPVTLAPAAAGAPGAAVALEGELSMARSRATHRSLDISLRCTPVLADGTRGPQQAAIYEMGVEK